MEVQPPREKIGGNGVTGRGNSKQSSGGGNRD